MTCTRTPTARRHCTKRLRRASITAWNLFALAVIVLGGLATLGAGQLYLHRWVDSGIHVPVGGRFDVHLPYGRTLVYYESKQSVPSRTPLLKVLDAYNIYVAVQPIPDEDNNYHTAMTGWSGRAIHVIDIDEEGTFTVSCSAADYLSIEDIPPDDRVSFFKSPNTLEDAQAMYKTVLIIGASITVLLAVLLYVLHFAALRSRAAAHPPRV
jgi:hypothetical protein